MPSNQRLATTDRDEVWVCRAALGPQGITKDHQTSQIDRMDAVGKDLCAVEANRLKSALPYRRASRVGVVKIHKALILRFMLNLLNSHLIFPACIH